MPAETGNEERRQRYEVKTYVVLQHLQHPFRRTEVVDVLLNRALALEIAAAIPHSEVRKYVAWRHSNVRGE